MNDICAICSRVPEDMLVLACSHNLCIDCATELHAISLHPNSLTCEICFTSTPLDPETVNCLSSLTARSNNYPLINQQKLPPRQPKGKQGQCIQHQQKSLYFCFDCENGAICSQCILSNLHQNHKVLTIKKAVKEICDSLVEHSSQLKVLKKNINHNSESIYTRKKEIISYHQENKQKLDCIFDQIQNAIKNKYNQLCQELDRATRRSLEILDGSLQAITMKSQQIDLAIEQNQKLISQNNNIILFDKYSQIGINKSRFIPELPAQLPENHFMLKFGSKLLGQLDTLLAQFSWIQKHTLVDQKYMNGFEGIEENEMSVEDTERSVNDQPIKIMNNIGATQHLPKQNNNGSLNNSVSKYSNIKSNSRRLQLSRSMDNATNIINKLQERIKK